MFHVPAHKNAECPPGQLHQEPCLLCGRTILTLMPDVCVECLDVKYGKTRFAEKSGYTRPDGRITRGPHELQVGAHSNLADLQSYSYGGTDPDES